MEYLFKEKKKESTHKKESSEQLNELSKNMISKNLCFIKCLDISFIEHLKYNNDI